MKISAAANVIGDLAAEAAALDTVLDSLDEAAWLSPTPAEGWDVRDTVSHLADTDDIAYDCVTGGSRDLGVEATEHGIDGFTAWQVSKGRTKTPAEVLSWWRTSNAKLLEVLRAHDPDQRIPWGPNKISLASFTTARIMEHWAHSLDIFAAAGTPPTDTDRLRHVAFLGARALPYHFRMNGLPEPGAVRLELTSPSGEAWVIGPDDAPNVIAGAASDWCRVAVQRDRNDERSRLRLTGPDADAILANVQAYL